MRTIQLGTGDDGQTVRIPKSAFQTHFHLIGGTGKGKTTAIHTLLHQLMMDPFEDACFLIVDRLGNLSFELLMWMASDFCTDDVRKRLVYIEPSNEQHVIGFNPLLFDTPAHGYYKVSRATEIILRAWESVNIEAMPRLARWTFNAFWAAAQLGLTIADCVHFLLPGSPHHAPLLACLPDRLRFEWEELIAAKGSEVVRILESSRNRLKPYFESDILRRMFGSTANRLDVQRFMREGKIIILNLAPQNRLSTQLADAIGALVLNEILAVARSLPRGVRYPTYLLLDEFQNFVGPDIEAALPEVRQLGLRLILSHQGFSQLIRGDYDLTTMIFQAQSRLVFGVQGEDADVLAHELASLTFDAKRIKDEIHSRRQLLSGHELIELESWSDSDGDTESCQSDRGWSDNRNSSISERDGSPHETHGRGTAKGESRKEGSGSSRSHQSSHSRTQHLKPTYDEFRELSSRTYSSFDEQKSEWAREVRRLKTGEALVRLVDDHRLHRVKVKRSAAGYLGWSLDKIRRELPEVFDGVDRLIEENYRSDVFSTPAAIDVEIERRIASVLKAGRPAHALGGSETIDDGDRFS